MSVPTEPPLTRMPSVRSGIPIQSRSQSSTASSSADAPRAAGPAARERVVAGADQVGEDADRVARASRSGRRTAGGRGAGRAGGSRRRAASIACCGSLGPSGQGGIRSAVHSGSAGAIGGCASSCLPAIHEPVPHVVAEAAQLVGRKAQRIHGGDNRTMRAAVMQSFEQPLVIEDVPDPVCEPDGVVVEVKATGVCRSDWHGWMGHDPSIALPHVPGHELCGVGRRGRGSGGGLRGRRPRHGAVLLRVRDVRAVPARRDPDLRARFPARVHRLGLVRASSSRCRART